MRSKIPRDVYNELHDRFQIMHNEIYAMKSKNPTVIKIKTQVMDMLYYSIQEMGTWVDNGK